MEILFLTDSDSNDIEIIASQAPEGVHIHHLRRESVDEAIQRAAEFEVVIGGRIPTDLLERATKENSPFRSGPAPRKLVGALRTGSLSSIGG